MFDFWQSELTEEETEQLIEKCAKEIADRKMEVPAMLFFEMHRPLGFIMSSGAVMTAPFLVPFLGFDNVNNYSRLFSKQENILKLLDRLESNKKEVVEVEESCK